ncbi:hypothetical protein HSX10_08190 [Winogradskyella undariae]|uniref:hypothetical protein n=1 Tax=Winogradskyella undariae TaxID=1285465 RepID=UPI00156AC96A|nr:hypothetical protein [Winogradskyella undariae]NRR91542.1 hypothetical protein [Winogradskyella undariae]
MYYNCKIQIAFILLALVFGCKDQQQSKIKDISVSEIPSNNYEENQKLDLTETIKDSLEIKKGEFTDYPLEEIHSNYIMSHKDSLDLLLFWRKTAFSTLETENSNLSNSKIKSLLTNHFDGDRSILVASVYTSPDNLFKIFVGRGESCGAYCNPYWVSQIVLENGQIIEKLEFKDLEHIYLMPDGKYLIKEKSFGRPASVYSEKTKSATLISFKDNEINYHQIDYNYPKYNEILNDSIYNPSGKLSLSQESFIETKHYLTYNKKSKTLSYSYATDFSFCCQVDSIYAYKGEFKYKNGQFIHLTEQKKYIEID